MSNDVKNYKKGDREKFIKMVLCLGVIPDRTYVLLNNNLASIRHTVNRWVAEGDFERIKPEKNMKAIIPGKELRKSLLDPNASKTIPLDETLFEEFKEKGIAAIYRVNAKPKGKEKIKELKVKRNRIYLFNESFIFLWGSGVQTLPNEKIPFTSLSKDNKQTSPSYYTSREINRLSDDFVSLNAANEVTQVISSSRINGIASLKSGAFAIYNTGSGIIEYHSATEQKAAIFVEVNSRRCGLGEFKGCILLYHTTPDLYEDASYKFLNPKTKKEKTSVVNLITAYKESIYAIPLSPEGQQIIQIMNKTPEWEEIILSVAISEDLRRNTTYTAFDGFRKEADGSNTYYFVYLIPNIERLRKFQSFIKLTEEENKEESGRANYRIFCYPFQEKTLRKSLPDYVQIKTITTDQVLSWFK